jgi:flagellar hook-associated protein 3 FlgL
MRITHSIMNNSVILNLRRQTERLFQAQTKLSTQKRLNKPSDDPIGMGRVLDYRTKLSVIDQYQRNVEQGKTQIESNDLTLGLVDDLIGLARGIAHEYGDSTMSAEARQLAANQVEDVYDQIMQLANSKSGNSYIFSGHQTDTAPFSNSIEISAGVPSDIDFGLTADATDVTIEIRDENNNVVRTIFLGDGITPGTGGTEGINTVSWDGLDDGGAVLSDDRYTFTITALDGTNPIQDYVTYKGDNGDIRIVTGENVEVRMDADGRNFFTPAGGVNLFEALKELVAALENPDAQAGSDQILASVDDLSQASTQINNKRAEYGPTLSRFEHSQNYWANLSAKIKIGISEIEDADVAEAAVELQSLELAYETTIATAARIIQPSLINFLK